jgi:uncharacterized membrane protein YfcA
MIFESRQAGAEAPGAEHEPLSAGTLDAASNALLVTAAIAGAALLLQLLLPWLAWGYVALALVFGIVFAVIAARVQRMHEREVDQVRRRHRSS